MHIPKLFWAPPQTYPDWPYGDRRAVGYHLDKSYSRNEPVYRFEHKGKVYEMKREKAQLLGRKYQCRGGVCPHLLPIAEMDKVYDVEKVGQEVIHRKVKNALF